MASTRGHDAGGAACPRLASAMLDLHAGTGGNPSAVGFCLKQGSGQGPPSAQGHICTQLASAIIAGASACGPSGGIGPSNPGSSGMQCPLTLAPRACSFHGTGQRTEGAHCSAAVPGSRARCHVDLLAWVPQAYSSLRFAVREAGLHKFGTAFKCLGDAPAIHTHCHAASNAVATAVRYGLTISTLFGCGAPTFLRQPGKNNGINAGRIHSHSGRPRPS